MDYLYGFTRMLRQHQVPAREWATWLTDSLQGIITSLLITLEEADLLSWDRLVAALNAQFGIGQDIAAARRELVGRDQGKKETVAEYIATLQLLARRAYT
jgi:hypothetical protein